MKDNRLEDIRKNLQKKAIPFYNTFTTAEGQEVLDALKAEFDPPAICAPTPHETVVRAAQRDVIEYIKTMIKLRADDYG